jgi:signal transduction histidine kinase
MDWSDFTHNRRVNYGRVGHGEYTFHANAISSSNISNSDPRSLGIRIRTPFYLKAWFYILLILILAGSVYLIIVIRERNFRRIKNNLIKNIDDKTKEVILKEEIIKERKKVEKELIEAKNHAEQSDKLKSAFLANISHEIRTPMNAIVGFSQLLNNPDISEDKKQYFVDLIRINSDQLLSLLDNIIELSELETGELKLEYQVCHVNTFLEKLHIENVSILEKAGKDTEIEFKFIPGFKDETFGIMTDQLRLRQILERLLDNAIKYTEKGHIHFGYEKNENLIRFFVTDTGVGLNEEQKEYMFKLFGKVGEKDKEKLYSGTGLGLSISQRLVALLNGKIGVESELGKGSTFYFDLPLTISEAK